MTDYGRLTRDLQAQRIARTLSRVLEAAVNDSPALTLPEKVAARHWLMTQDPEAREGFRLFLDDLRRHWERDEAELDAMWPSFGDPTDRLVAREWWDKGLTLGQIARRFGWIYLAQVSEGDIGAWKTADGWPAREMGDSYEGAA